VKKQGETPMTHIDKHKFGPWAIVTGASSGIGKEFARQLAGSGLNVVLLARRLPLLEELGRQLEREFGVQYRAIGLDLTEDGFLETIEAATHDLDIGLLISNAGAGIPGEFLALERGALLRIVRLNIIAHLDLAHHFGQRLAARGRGGMLLVSAMGAAQGIPYMASDSGTKAFVLSLGEALHVEFEKLGLHVTVLLPSPTDTPVLAEFGLDVGTMPIKPMSVEQCVDEGLAALGANRATHITGRMFRILAALTPRSMVTRMNGNMLAKAVAAKRARAQR
jgi:short-subunit dehydrogenase